MEWAFQPGFPSEHQIEQRKAANAPIIAAAANKRQSDAQMAQSLLEQDSKCVREINDGCVSRPRSLIDAERTKIERKLMAIAEEYGSPNHGPTLPYYIRGQQPPPELLE